MDSFGTEEREDWLVRSDKAGFATAPVGSEWRGRYLGASAGDDSSTTADRFGSMCTAVVSFEDALPNRHRCSPLNANSSFLPPRLSSFQNPLNPFSNEIPSWFPPRIGSPLRSRSCLTTETSSPPMVTTWTGRFILERKKSGAGMDQWPRRRSLTRRPCCTIESAAVRLDTSYCEMLTSVPSSFVSAGKRSFGMSEFSGRVVRAGRADSDVWRDDSATLAIACGLVWLARRWEKRPYVCQRRDQSRVAARPDVKTIDTWRPTSHSLMEVSRPQQVLHKKATHRVQESSTRGGEQGS